MEVIVKPINSFLDDYIKLGISSIMLPLEGYAVEYTNYYSLDQIKNIRRKYPNIKLFISMNKNLLNDEINKVKEILQELEKINIKAIFFYDLAILKLKHELNLKIDLVWSQTHMVTNDKTCNYYYEQGVKYALLSKEITKEEAITIKKNSAITPIIELISYPCIAFSKRKLVSNYYSHTNQDKKCFVDIKDIKTKQQFKLIENQDGVSFIGKKVMNGSKILRDLLENDFSYILLKEDLFDHEVFLNCLTNILYYINNYKNMTKEEDRLWLKMQNELLGRNTNFFYRKSIYKVK